LEILPEHRKGKVYLGILLLSDRSAAKALKSVLQALARMRGSGRALQVVSQANPELLDFDPLPLPYRGLHRQV
jgi:hypothetical protein